MGLKLFCLVSHLRASCVLEAEPCCVFALAGTMAVGGSEGEAGNAEQRQGIFLFPSCVVTLPTAPSCFYSSRGRHPSSLNLKRTGETVLHVVEEQPASRAPFVRLLPAWCPRPCRRAPALSECGATPDGGTGGARGGHGPLVTASSGAQLGITGRWGTGHSGNHETLIPLSSDSITLWV